MDRSRGGKSRENRRAKVLLRFRRVKTIKTRTAETPALGASQNSAVAAARRASRNDMLSPRLLRAQAVVGRARRLHRSSSASAAADGARKRGDEGRGPAAEPKVPYDQLGIGVPRETWTNEKRYTQCTI